MLLFTLVISLWSFAGTPRRPVDLRQSPSYSPRATASSCALPMRLRQLRGDRIGGFVGQQSDTSSPGSRGAQSGRCAPVEIRRKRLIFAHQKRSPDVRAPCAQSVIWRIFSSILLRYFIDFIRIKCYNRIKKREPIRILSSHSADCWTVGREVDKEDDYHEDN